ncbi:MAG: discoidin domain-containing protein, partial [Muribaculaceae bacterium]|nr:discoidin domain-containing protein [Muribaculaceae bacterium]
IPFNEAYCTFILNVAPNTDGLIDDNAMAALSKIGELWKPREGKDKVLTTSGRPITAENIAKRRPAESSWSDDGSIMDYANDDNFGSAWISNRCVKEPWYMVKLDRSTPINTITLTDHNHSFDSYRIYYDADGEWVEIPVTPQDGKVKVHSFDTVNAAAVKVTFHPTTEKMTLHEIGVYNQR